MSDTHITLDRMPRMLALLPNIAKSLIPFLPKRTANAPISLSVSNVKADLEALSLYRTITGHTGPEKGLPLLFPFCMNTPALISLGSHPSVNLPFLGSVHIRIQAEQLKPMPEAAAYRFENSLTEIRAVKKGKEFVLLTEMYLGDECYWRSTNTILCPGKPRGEIVEPETLESLPIEFPTVAQFEVGSNMARRYARASGDWNPIHQLDLMAKLFGFKKTIIHGMWMLSKAMSFFEMEDQCSVTGQFKGPVYLGDHCQLQADFTKAENRVDVIANHNTRPNICFEFQGMQLKSKIGDWERLCA